MFDSSKYLSDLLIFDKYGAGTLILLGHSDLSPMSDGKHLCRLFWFPGDIKDKFFKIVESNPVLLIFAEKLFLMKEKEPASISIPMKSFEIREKVYD
jgi:hypothetical protein